jgi:hypothetical protein
VETPVHPQVATVARSLCRAIVAPWQDAVAAVYAPTAMVHGPLGVLRGQDAIGGFLRETARMLPGLRASLHEVFSSADGRRLCVRTRLGWRHEGHGFGRPPSGRVGDAALVHALALDDERAVIEHVVGFSNFDLPQVLLADWGLPVVPVADPRPEVMSAKPGEPGVSSGDDTLGRRFVRAFGARDLAAVEGVYDPDVELFTPLGWPLRGRDRVLDFVAAFHAANPGMRVALHDEFASADGARRCWRIRLHFHNTAPFYGNPPTGDEGEMPETHALWVRDGRIVRQVVGDNSFALPKQELVDWAMPFPTGTPDPDPAIVSMWATAESEQRQP